MASEYTYTFFRISKTEHITASAHQYRELRLKALSVAPESFSSTYAIESAFDDKTWVQRITEQEKETFICAASHSGSGTTEWVGQVSLRGPLAPAEYNLPEESGQPPADPDAPTENWQVLSLFNLPEHRGRGIGKKLCLEALSYLKSERPASKFLVRIMVRPQNTVTVGLYESLDFRSVGFCTLEEALVANGDTDMLPKDYATRSEYTTRGGVIMTRLIST